MDPSPSVKYQKQKKWLKRRIISAYWAFSQYLSNVIPYHTFSQIQLGEMKGKGPCSAQNCISPLFMPHFCHQVFVLLGH